MKFTDGNWLTLPGVKVAHPAEAYDARRSGDTLELFAPTRPVRHRGDTLEGPMLTVRLSSPLPGVIRVRVTHFEGGPDAGPHFTLDAGDAPVQIEIDDTLASLTSGPLRAEVTRFPWNLRFLHGGEPLTRSAGRGMGYVRRDDGQTFVHEGLTLDVGELVYGLGERFTAFVKNGQTVDIWNRDGGTGSDQAYKNVPFYLSSKGYGVFVNDPGAVSFEVATERVSRVQFSVPGEALEYLVIAGPTPAEVLDRYTRLTGRPALPPPWSFGLWLSTSFTTDYDEGTVTSFLDGMAERDIPLSVFHFDCFWMRAFQWCDFQWDPAVFPDPEGMLARLHERGLRVSVWINPYVAQKSPLFAEAAREGYLLRRVDGGVWQGDLWQPGMGIVDFTNPVAAEWFAGHIRRLARQGVDAIKTDFGERIPHEGVAWHDGSDPARMHNYYPQLYNACVFRALDAERPGEATLFARSATAGGQAFPVHWGGDCDSTFESMAESLRGGLSLGLSGFGFWSHDIGGFEGAPPPALYKRWVAFGLLSSHSRLHASTSYRVPWLIDEESVDVLRFFTRLKQSLMPYLWAQAVTAHRTGLPMMRAMILAFPDDPACAALDRQFLLGDALLVAPVFREDGRVQVYLPAGPWTHLLTGEVAHGPAWRTEMHGVLSVPLYVRPGTLLATHEDHAPPLLTLYALQDGAVATATLHRPDGTEDFTVTARRDGGTLHLTRTGPDRPYRFRIAGQDTAHDVQADAAVLQQNSEGLRVFLNPDESSEAST